jgi:hypothetical protein
VASASAKACGCPVADLLAGQAEPLAGGVGLGHVGDPAKALRAIGESAVGRPFGQDGQPTGGCDQAVGDVAGPGRPLAGGDGPHDDGLGVDVGQVHRVQLRTLVPTAPLPLPDFERQQYGGQSIPFGIPGQPHRRAKKDLALVPVPPRRSDRLTCTTEFTGSAAPSSP